MTATSDRSAASCLTVRAPARLHMGFLDPSGTLGRVFGSIGVALNEIETRIMVRSSEHLMVSSDYRDRCAAVAQKVSSALGFPVAAEIAIEETIPEHVGLGSGTQFALALAVGLYRRYGLAPPVREVARLIGRGRRSGVGIAAFEQGGFIVDGGHGANTLTPPLLARFEFPAEWRFILAFDRRGNGLHGDTELAAFRSLPAFPEQEAARICHRVLLRALPALCERDLTGFGAEITDIQRSIGDYFSPAQGGRFTSRDVEESLEWLRAKGAVGIGQTSWGPTGFCLTGTLEQAHRLAEEARERFRHRSNLDFLVASARNQGARIQTDNAQENEQPPRESSASSRPDPQNEAGMAKTAP